MSRVRKRLWRGRLGRRSVDFEESGLEKRQFDFEESSDEFDFDTKQQPSFNSSKSIVMSSKGSISSRKSPTALINSTKVTPSSFASKPAKENKYDDSEFAFEEKKSTPGCQKRIFQVSPGVWSVGKAPAATVASTTTVTNGKRPPPPTTTLTATKRPRNNNIAKVTPTSSSSTTTTTNINNNRRKKSVTGTIAADQRPPKKVKLNDGPNSSLTGSDAAAAAVISDDAWMDIVSLHEKCKKYEVLVKEKESEVQSLQTKYKSVLGQKDDEINTLQNDLIYSQSKLRDMKEQLGTMGREQCRDNNTISVLRHQVEDQQIQLSELEDAVESYGELIERYNNTRILLDTRDDEIIALKKEKILTKRKLLSMQAMQENNNVDLIFLLLALLGLSSLAAWYVLY